MLFLNRVRASPPKVPLVVTVKQLLQMRNPSVVPIDVSWHLPWLNRSAAAEFEAARVPQARRLDLDTVAKEHFLKLPNMMPDPPVFQKACQKLGISRDTHVVLYDTTGIFSSPRALFMFKAFGHENASILDGGLPAWIDAGYEVESGVAAPLAESEYPLPVYDSSVVKSYEQIIENVNKFPNQKSEMDVVIDVRWKESWAEQIPEPRAGMRPGHIPHSYSVPFENFLVEHKSEKTGEVYHTMIPTEAIEGAIQAKLPADAYPEGFGNREIVNTCASGMTVGISWLALQLIGIRSSIYDESWMGYSQRAESPIANVASADAKKP